MAWNDSLLDDQAEAASYHGNHARLLAGPGTGKTFVLTRRIVYLVTELGIPAEEILAITFTRAAAHELKQRVAEELGENAMPRISTLHSFALRQLLRNSNKLNDLPQPLRIADDWEERHIILEDLKATLGLARIDDVRELLNQLAADWESLAADQGVFMPDANFIGAWERHRSVFGYTLRSELVYQLKRAIEQIADFELDAPLQHLLVDEYQDLNRCDLAVVRSVVGLGLELFVAGDDDQSIYGFRKAHPEGIRRFTEDYDGSVSLPIEVCMRCDTEILALGEFVADLDVNRLPKITRPQENRPPGQVALLRFDDQFDEARGIASLCRCLMDGEDYAPSDILILSRVNTRRAYSSVLETAFAEAGIPFAGDVASSSPIDEDEGRIILSALRLLRNTQDHLAWRSIIMLRRNGIGAGITQRVIDLALERQVPFAVALQMINENNEVLPTYGGRVSAEYAQIHDRILQLARAFNLEELSAASLESLIDGVLDLTVEDRDAEVTARDFLIEKFVTAEAESLNDFLPTIESASEAIEQDLVPDSVNMLTMHKAKGLSAGAVIVMAAEDETIPGRQENEPALGDERRLLYVSLTRAKHKLFVTYCNKRLGQQAMLGRHSGRKRRTLTRFLRHGPVHPMVGTQFVQELCEG